jgi:hypothetical protein
MSEHLSSQMVERYRQRLMSPAELLDFDDHIVCCGVCRQRLFNTVHLQAEASSLRLELNSLPDVLAQHPDYFDFAAFVDDRLDTADREILKSHIEMCEDCAEELRDLLAFKASLANVPEELCSVEPSQAKRPHQWRFPRTRFAGAFAMSLVFIGISAAVWLVLRSDATRKTETVKSGPAAPDEKSGSPEFFASPTLPKKSPRDITVALKDGGGRVTLDKDGNLAGLESLPFTYQAAVKTVLTRQRVETSRALSAVLGRSETLMGTPETVVSFAIRTPVGTVVRSDRPVFRWTSLNGATSYTVEIYDSNFRKVATSPSLSTGEWTVVQGLKRGEIYSWQVKAVRAGVEITSPTAPAPQARFKVLEQRRANELNRAQKEYGRSHLTLGALYSRDGLVEEAEREFRALVKANPNSSVARKLLRDVLSARRGIR